MLKTSTQEEMNRHRLECGRSPHSNLCRFISVPAAFLGSLTEGAQH